MLKCLLEQTCHLTPSTQVNVSQKTKPISTFIIGCDAVFCSQYIHFPLYVNLPIIYIFSDNAVKTKYIIHLETKSFSAYVDSLSI